MCELEPKLQRTGLQALFFFDGRKHHIILFVSKASGHIPKNTALHIKCDASKEQIVSIPQRVQQAKMLASNCSTPKAQRGVRGRLGTYGGDA